MKCSLLDELKRLKLQRQTRPNCSTLDKVIEQSKKIIPVHYKQNRLEGSQPKFVTKQKSINKTLFNGLSFCFPVKDVQTTPRVILGLTKAIEKYGGSVIEFAENMKGVRVKYLLCSLKVDIISLERNLHFKVTYQQIINYRYVWHCIDNGRIIDITGYLLYDCMHSIKQHTETTDLEDKGEWWQGHMSMYDSVRKRTKTLFDQDKEKENNGEILISDNKKNNKFNKQLNRDQFLFQKDALEIELKQKVLPKNQIIIEKLQQLQKIYTNQRDVGRKLAYMKAVSAIKALTTDIESIDQLKEVKGIGSKLKDKIREIIETGMLRKLDNLQGNDKNLAMGQLTKVWGLGPAKATELYQKHKIKTITDLTNNKDTLPLTKNQLLGIKYYKQFEQRIPRPRVTLMFQKVKGLLYELVGSQETHIIQCCGSYRRKKPNCGDMDIIISRKDGKFEKELLIDFINKLEEQNFLTDHLSLPHHTDQGFMSYMGVCQFQETDQEAPTHHRIDIKNYPMDCYAFALLYFTGSDAFNRSMRLYASKKGLSMSDRGFVDRDDKGKSSFIFSKVKCHTEEQIFKYLGLDYKTPQERSI